MTIRSAFVDQRWLRPSVAMVTLFGALWLAGSAGAQSARTADAAHDGAVYVMSNSPAGNAVQVFFRGKDGLLDKGPLVRTGGLGSAVNPPFGFPIADSSGSVTLSPDNRLLFVTNLGSDTISSFRVTRSGLELADVEASHGVRPISVVAHRWPAGRLEADDDDDQAHGGRLLLYALNEGVGLGPGSIAGFTVDRSGAMSFLTGSVRALSSLGFAGQIGFDRKGAAVTVSQRGGVNIPPFFGGGRSGEGPDRIDTFVLGVDGRPGPAIAHESPGEDPFGFLYTKNDVLIMSNGGFVGTASSYALDPETGALRHLGTVAAGGAGTCWVAFDKHERYTFMTNSLSGNISRFAIERDGGLRLLGVTPVALPVPVDEDTDRDGRYLYVLESLVGPTGFVHARPEIFRIEDDGGLTSLGLGDVVAFPGATGLAAF